MTRKLVCLAAALVLGVGATPAWGEEVYYYTPVQDLTITRGELPSPAAERAAADRVGWGRARQLRRAMWPYVVCAADVEAYLADSQPRTRSRRRDGVAFAQSAFLALRAPDGREPLGFIVVPKPDLSGMVRVDFAAPVPAADQADARAKFDEAKRRHYQRLLDRDIPGAAWFRHQMRQAGLGQEGPAGAPNRGRQRGQRNEVDRLYALFSGGRAVSENLQLDRDLRVASGGARTIDVASIQGITTAEIDWKPVVEGMDPKRDALAAAIPADQHVMFFPTFQAMITLMDEAHERGTPVLHLLETRAEDAGTGERYKRQLCLPTSTLSRILGPSLIGSVAFTGSDPYLRTGSDVAVLFEAKNVPALQAAITARQTAGASADSQPVSGHVQGTPYSGMVSRDRRVCSYLAVVGETVIVTNSLHQLDRVVLAATGKTPSLASLDEYTFFRDRYRLGDPEETGLLILTDAAIRRWCGPRWRIGAARRTQAAAVLAELQAQALDTLAEGQVAGAGPASTDPALGDVTLTSDGVSSTIYNTLEFLTPIAEIPMDKVTEAEQNAYGRFRGNYQRQWRQFFDPIAIRFTATPGRVAADVTVRPLIASSEYRQFMEVTAGVSFDPTDGDLHREALLHWILSLDTSSGPFRMAGGFAMGMAPGLGPNPLSWVGNWITMYADDDPLWQALAQAAAEKGEKGAEAFMEQNVHKLPVAVAISVKNPLKLVGFLATLRAFIEQTAPGMATWETLKHNEQPYVKVSPTEQARAGMGDEAPRDLAVYYAATPRMLVLTLSEPLLQRALDRIAAKQAPPAHTEWLGRNMALKATQKVVTYVMMLARNDMGSALEGRSWDNLVILNEWRRRYPKASPVDFHQRFWQTRLVCPGGGEYVWNEEFQTMASTVFGHPGQPQAKPALPNPLADVTQANLGLTFEDNGLRARGELTRKTKGAQK